MATATLTESENPPAGSRVPALFRVVEREARLYRRLWRGNFFSSFVSPFLYLGAMGIGLGGLIETAGNDVDGVSYLQFVAPGLLAATALQNAAGESLWAVLGGLKWTRQFHAMVTAPMTAADVCLGVLTWNGLRLALNAAVFLVVAGLLGALASPWALLALPAATLTGLCFAACITAFSATQQEDIRFPLVMRLVVMPLFLFSGTFYPVDQLPSAIQPLVWLSPLWHGIELCRAATTGRSPGALLLVLHLAVLFAVLGIGTILAVRNFTRRLAS